MTLTVELVLIVLILIGVAILVFRRSQPRGVGRQHLLTLHRVRLLLLTCLFVSI